MHEIQQQALINLGIKELNPMQVAACQAILKESEILLLAPTGSGKTVAFLLPIQQLLDTSNTLVQCLILVPSRELALQIEKVWKTMGTGFKVNVCYGGHDARIERDNLSNPPALLIGTPGRIVDHIQRGRLELAETKILVLDEFDKSLELGFQEEMGFIMKELQRLDKKILVSATSSIPIPDFAKVRSPCILKYIAEQASGSSELTLKLVWLGDKNKEETLFQLICSLGSEPALIFCNHREACERASAFLTGKGIVAAFYHGGMEQKDRERALIQFRNGSVNYLVTTDLAARGLDIPEMKHVIHFQLPLHENEFTHRNGRTARMNAKGTAYLIMNKKEKQPVYINSSITEYPLSEKNRLPDAPLFQTLYINGGKKDKLNTFDIVGCFLQKGKLNKDDVGLIEVQDFNSYVAVKENKVSFLLDQIREEKIKGKKYKIGIAR